MIKCCNTCKIYIPQVKTCQLMPSLQGQIKPDDYCSQHKDEIEQCELCHKGILKPYLRVVDDIVHVYCEECISRI